MTHRFPPSLSTFTFLPMLVMCLLTVPSGLALPAQAQSGPAIGVAPATVPSGGTFTVNGYGFQDYVSAAHGITLSVFDGNDNLVDTDEVALNPDGSLHTQWQASSPMGPYPPAPTP